MEPLPTRIAEEYGVRDGKYYVGTRGILYVMRADPPRAWALIPKRGWVGCTEAPPFDVNRCMVRGDLRQISRICHRSDSTFCGDLQTGQMYFPEFGLPPRLYRLQRLRKTNDDLEAFYNVIPKQQRELLGRFRCGQYPMWSVLHRYDAAHDLLQTNPFLLWLVAHRKRFAGRRFADWRKVNRLLRQKQRTIVEALEFGPAAESIVKSLRKIPPCEISYWLAYRLRDLLVEPEFANRLAHLPNVTKAALDVITDPELDRHVTPSFLNELSEAGENAARHVYAIRDALHFAEYCERDLRRLRFKRLRHLQRVVEELRDEAAARDYQSKLDLKFPPPPVPGTDWIQPITDPKALYDEGTLQNHCCATYATRVARQMIYFYRVLLPERATVAIDCIGGRWQIVECRKQSNNDISNETRAAIEHWLDLYPAAWFRPAATLRAGYADDDDIPF